MKPSRALRPLCLVISERVEDVQFGSKVAAICGMDFRHAVSVAQSREYILSNPDAIVFWDLDNPKALEKGDSLAFPAVAQMLVDCTGAERVFGVSDEALSSIPYVFNSAGFGHHVFRRMGDPAPELLSRIVRSSLSASPYELRNYVTDESPQTIMIRKSGHRRPAVTAIVNLLERIGVHPRLSSLAAQAVDELLMNAIFNAPVSLEGKAYMRARDRSEEFDLREDEVVTLEMGLGSGYAAISVSDQFGSLEKSTVLSFIRKDYQRLNYKLKPSQTSAGLGIYGMTQSGLSLLFVSQAKSLTKAVLFVPRLENFRDFRSSFRFFSFISR